MRFLCVIMLCCVGGMPVYGQDKDPSDKAPVVIHGAKMRYHTKKNTTTVEGDEQKPASIVWQSDKGKSQLLAQHIHVFFNGMDSGQMEEMSFIKGVHHFVATGDIQLSMEKDKQVILFKADTCTSKGKRVVCGGHVSLIAKGNRICGDQGVFDFDRGVFDLKGTDAKKIEAVIMPISGDF